MSLTTHNQMDYSRSDRTESLSTKKRKHALRFDSPGQWIQELVLRNSPTGTRKRTGPLTGRKTKTLRRILEMPATLSLSFGYHGERVGNGLQPNTTQSHSRYQRLRNRGSLGGPTHEIRGRQKKNPRCHLMTGHPQKTRVIRRDLTAVPRGHAHEPRMGSARSNWRNL